MCVVYVCCLSYSKIGLEDTGYSIWKELKLCHFWVGVIPRVLAESKSKYTLLRD